jgi:hypothetical protein
MRKNMSKEKFVFLKMPKSMADQILEGVSISKQWLNEECEILEDLLISHEDYETSVKFSCSAGSLYVNRSDPEGIRITGSGQSSLRITTTNLQHSIIVRRS